MAHLGHPSYSFIGLMVNVPDEDFYSQFYKDSVIFDELIDLPRRLDEFFNTSMIISLSL